MGLLSEWPDLLIHVNNFINLRRKCRVNWPICIYSFNEFGGKRIYVRKISKEFPRARYAHYLLVKVNPSNRMNKKYLSISPKPIPPILNHGYWIVNSVKFYRKICLLCACAYCAHPKITSPFRTCII